MKYTLPHFMDIDLVCFTSLQSNPAGMWILIISELLTKIDF